MTLDEFMASPLDRAWIRNKEYSLYIRKGPRYIEHVLHQKVIQIASIKVRFKGRGTFTRLVNYLRERYPDHTLFVECVLEPKLVPRLLRLGFHRELNTYPGNFYLTPEMELKPAERAAWGRV